MKITHYLYNAFLIDEGATRVAIDPGQCLWLFELQSLIPRSEWSSVTHVLITHGDPDHHWQSDRIASASGAHVVCGRGLTRQVDGHTRVVAPRGRGLTSWVEFENLHPLDVGAAVRLDGVRVEGLPAVHGPIEIPILGFKFRREPGPGERVGIGSIAFRIDVSGVSLLNLGDSVFLPEWEGVSADVLMLPIGGLGKSTWTMDVDEALRAVAIIRPDIVIPCHYNVPLFWKRRFAVADDRRFAREAEALGAECRILARGESTIVG